MIDSNNEIKKLSKGLLDAVRGVMEGKAGTAPKTEKEKDLAAHAPPHDKITHADVLVGRGVLKKHPKTGKLVTKEEAEPEAQAVDTKEIGMRALGSALKKMRSESREEEGEQIDEAMDAAARFHQHHANAKDLLKSISQHLNAHADAAKASKDYKGKKGPNWGHVGTMEHVAQQLGSIHDMLARHGEYATEEVETTESGESLTESTVDGVAAGSLPNDGHLCATKVMHKEWAEGTPIHSQHAEPDENGDIAWYDVMFEHGIEKRVMVEDLEILMAETHERHGKKKMKEEVEGLSEAKVDVEGDGDEGASVMKVVLKKHGIAVKNHGPIGDADKYTFHKGGKKIGEHHVDWHDSAEDVVRGFHSVVKKHLNNPLRIRSSGDYIHIKEEVEELDELSTDTLKSYRKKARAQGNAIVDKMKMGGGDWSKDQKDTKTLTKRAAGANMSGKKLVKRGESLKTEELELDEARGRPRKNPLPAGQSDEPEPRQHIIQQLQRAKLSMRGGEHVTFKDGTKHHVSGDHAAKILAKYSGMRPAQKEEFQKKIGSSHSAFKEEL